VLGITGYLGALEKSADPDAGDRADNVWELIHDAGVFRKDWGDDEAETAETRLEMLAGFLEHCRSMRAPDETANADARVTLSTLHRAKGLEFDTVIIAGFDAEHLPSRGTLSTADGNEEAVVEEERRLAYVGMTRARTELYLSVPQMTGRRGHERPTHPSPFLDEIPAELRTAAPEPKRIDRAAKRTKRRDPPKRGMTMGPYGPEVHLFD
jgi:DNA helicase-2/ATP-dependent DNA helicase PcrA